MAAIRRTAPDLVFLDLQMPGLGGFEAVAEIGPERMPMVVFVTAHDEHAIQAFELLPPIRRFHAFGLNPADIGGQAVRQCAMHQRLFQALV